jgi:hypothetical protein
VWTEPIAVLLLLISSSSSLLLLLLFMGMSNVQTVAVEAENYFTEVLTLRCARRYKRTLH